MINVLQLSHTDIRSDSRILKEMNALSECDRYNVSGIGIQMNEGNKISPEAAGFKIFALPLKARKEKYLPRLARSILILIELTVRMLFRAIKSRPKVIHCNDVLVLPVGVILKFLTRSRLIYDAHELESNRNGISKIESKLTFYVEKILWPFVDALIVVSPSIEQWYIDNIGSKKTTVILNSPVLNLSSQINDTSKDNYFREKYNISADSKIFLYVGILCEGRGIELILDVFNRIGVESHLIFLGYGQLSDDLKMLSKKHLNIHVHDAVAHDKVVEIAKSADVGLCLIQNVSLSDYYCLPNKLFEYCFAGIPVLASNFPDISNVVNQYKIGLTVDLNVEAIADGVKSFESGEIDVNFSVSDLSELGWETQAKKLMDLYENVLSN